MRIAEQLTDHNTPIVSHDAVQLGKSLVLRGNLTQHGDEESSIELIVRVRQHLSIAELRNDVSEPSRWARCIV